MVVLNGAHCQFFQAIGEHKNVITLCEAIAFQSAFSVVY